MNDVTRIQLSSRQRSSFGEGSQLCFMMSMFVLTSQDGGTLAPPLLSQEPAVAIPYLVVVVLATVVGFVGNVLIIGAFIVSRRVRIVGNEFVFNLALADLVITVLADPFLILGVTAGEAWFTARPGLCDFVAAVCLGTCICAFLTLTAVTISRYIYVCHGDRYNSVITRRRMVALCISCWLLAFLLESPNFLGWGDHKFDRKHNSCMWDRTKSLSYTLFLSIGLIGGPITIMVIAYVLIFLKIRRMKKRVAADTVREAPGVASSRAGVASWGRAFMNRDWWEAVKSTRTFFLILVAFVITWGPYAVVNAVDTEDTYSTELHLYVSGWAHLHSAFNCVIYGLTSVHFRVAFRRVLCLSTGRVTPKFNMAPQTTAGSAVHSEIKPGASRSTEINQDGGFKRQEVGPILR